MNANFSSEKELKNTKRTAEKRSKSSKKTKLKIASQITVT